MYSIGDVEALTGVKAHILRYWETIVPGIAPQKDFGGRRLYSQSELEKIYRLKYLIYEKKFTIEGAKAKLIKDSEQIEKNSLAIIEIRKMRKELLELYDFVKNLKNPFKK